MKARISEIFESIQGEGIYTGQKQVFVRFFGCNLNCNYCDTKLFRYDEYLPKDVLYLIQRFGNGYQAVSLTGGEPLLQKDFLKEMLPLIKKANKRVHLETNGTLSCALREVIDYIDIIAMDIKLPSSGAGPDLFSEHSEFLKIARNKDVFIKTIICPDTKESDILKAFSLVSLVDRNIPFVLQPNHFEFNQRLWERMEEFKTLGADYLNDIRMRLQFHKIVGAR